MADSGEHTLLNQKSGKGGVPSAAAQTPAAGGLPPGHGGMPPGLAKRLSGDVFTPQHARPPVDLQPRPTGEKLPPQLPEPPLRPDGAAIPNVIGRTGPEGKPVPYISQFSPEGAESGYNGVANCGPAAAAMIARSVGYGNELTDAQLVNALAGVGGTTSIGTSGNGMIAMFEEMGLQTAASEGADLGWIQQQVQTGNFVTALGDYYEVPGRTDPALSSGHYLTIIGMDRQTGDFQVVDPADPRVQTLTAAQLTNFINSHPEGGFALSAGK